METKNASSAETGAATKATRPNSRDPYHSSDRGQAPYSWPLEIQLHHRAVVVG